jgi:hypothetical protein
VYCLECRAGYRYVKEVKCIRGKRHKFQTNIGPG